MSELKVKVTKFNDRKYWIAYYDCPLEGRRITRSTRKTTRREAERFAAVWEADLREGRYKPPSKITWADFRARYESEHLASLASKTEASAVTAFNRLEAACRPKRLADVTADRLSHFQRELREQGLSESSIRSYLAHIKAALKWAKEQELLHEVPKIRMPARAKNGKLMKGRPITGEEFERMLAKVEDGLVAASFNRSKRAVKWRWSAEAKRKRLRDKRQRAEQVAAPWRFFLQALFTGGLRLSEALALSWDNRPDRITVDFSGHRPMLHIRAGLEKGNQDRLYPIAPEFARLLEAIPMDQRRGDVFRLCGISGQRITEENRVGKIISEIGKAAGVRMNIDGKGRVKYASAHDLRRSFGTRWSARVMPAQLQKLMRHASIDTTMKYYVQAEATELADEIWNAYERAEASNGAGVNSSVNTRTDVQ